MFHYTLVVMISFGDFDTVITAHAAHGLYHCMLINACLSLYANAD